MCTSRNRFGDVATIADATIADDRDAKAICYLDTFRNRRDLGHPRPTHHPRRTDAAGALTDLDGIDAPLTQGPRRFTRRDVAGN